MTRQDRLKLAKAALENTRLDLGAAQHAYGAAPRTDIDEAFKCLCDAVEDLTHAVEALCEEFTP